MKLFYNKNQKRQGFTIIETLVAVAILMIAIAGPLTIAHKGLLAAVYAHNQVTASYLAQDAMEYIKNKKDTNMLQTTPPVDWLLDIRGCTTACSVDTLSGSISSNLSLPCASCVLYKSAIGYNHDSGQAKTQFTRYFFLSDIDGVNDDEAKLTVIVTWNNGLISNQVLYESEIFKVTK